MGGCASTPKELGGATVAAPVQNSVPEPEVTEKHVDVVAAQEEVKVETTTENESKELAPLVDLSSPRTEAEKAPVVELAPEVHELKVEELAKVDQTVVAEDTPAEAYVAPVAEVKEKEKVVVEKVEDAKVPAVMADEKIEKVSA